MVPTQAGSGVGVSTTVHVLSVPACAPDAFPGRTHVGLAALVQAGLPGLNLPGVMASFPVLNLPGVVAFRSIPPGAVLSDIGIEFVRLPGAVGNITAQGLGFPAALFGLLPQPCRVNLCLLGVGTRPDGLGLPFAGVDFHILGLTPDLGGLFPVLPVPLLLHGLPAFSASQEEQHDQHHHDNGNNYPYPWNCVHVSHHFPLCCDRAGPRHSG